ncbi:cation:dicarboxylase symporter family transporter [Bosea sp. 117]|uniref:dicarboxylate/amino acid:cation symporter n=1 Tax=Bosea sp. 117 TaxID=1125973 RepID=UPI00049414E8|nr:cation:dicarboxylase symporter family transporter [Bosea sp. 117]
MSTPKPVEARAFNWRGALRRVLRSPLTTIFMIGAGILCGLHYPELSHAMGPAAHAYLNLLKMVVLPFLVSSVIFSITSMVQDPQSVRYLGKIALAVLAVSFISVMVSGTLATILQQGQIDDPQSRIQLGQFINSQGTVSTDLELTLAPSDADTKTVGPLSIFLNLVPNNVFSALASGEAIQVLLFCLLFGLAMGNVPRSSSTTFAGVLDAVYRSCIILTNWFIWALPFTTFILIADQTAKMGAEPLKLMGGFLLVMGLASAIAMATAFAIVSIRSGRSYWASVKAFQPLLMVAITTRSTVASLPWIINLLTERLRFSAVVVELLVPLQAALLRTGPIFLYTIGTIFIAQLYGRSLSIADLTLVGVVASLLALTTTGMSGIVILSQMSILCGYLKLPFEAAFALFVAVDAVTDTFMTLASVSTVAASTAAIAPHEGHKDSHPVPAASEAPVLSEARS